MVSKLLAQLLDLKKVSRGTVDTLARFLKSRGGEKSKKKDKQVVDTLGALTPT